MFQFKIIGFLFHLIVLLSISQLCATQFQEGEKIVIEGSSNTLKKIFTEFNQIRDAMNALKTSIQEYSKQPVISPKNLPLFDIRYDELPKKCVTEVLPKNCGEATSCTRRSGIYKIQVAQYSFEPFYVECDAETEDGDWTVIQRRHDGSEDFYRNWDEFEKGFGDVDKEFFIGLKKLYALTNYNGPQELLIIMEDANNTRAFAKYNAFAIGSDAEMYKLKSLGSFSGTAGNSLQAHLGMKFTTKDRDNDIHKDLNCAVNFTGAWWHKMCHHSNLNGKYGDNTFGKGINWLAFRGHTTSLKYVKMMIRRRRINATTSLTA